MPAPPPLAATTCMTGRRYGGKRKPRFYGAFEGPEVTQRVSACAAERSGCDTPDRGGRRPTNRPVQLYDERESDEAMAGQKIRIRLKSYDHEVIDNSARKIVDKVTRAGA